MIQSYTCANLRRLAVLEDPKNAGWNGIDYLEVAQKADGSGATLTVVFARGLGLAALTASQIRITGGVRFGPPTVATVTPDVPNRTVVVETLGATDFSAYTFTLVKSAAVDVPPDNFDPELSFLEFEFKADCPSPLDCEAPSPAPDLVPPGPSIDYLAKDFNSFRQAMLDRLSVTSPKWTERNPADLGVAIVEVLAYAGDYLSYYQDAVATEAYLGTARLRTSVRRHSRLLAYPMHDGCNARAFVFFELGGVRINLPKGAPLLIRRPDSAVLPPSALLNPQGPVFETMHAQTLWPDLNQILFHTFFDTGCVLPQGATSATLWDQTGALSTPGPNAQPLRLRPGDLMLFEEIASSTGVAADADPAIRHVVRLTSVTPWQESIVLPGEPGPVCSSTSRGPSTMHCRSTSLSKPRLPTAPSPASLPAAMACLPTMVKR